MLQTWLVAAERSPQPYDKFRVFDVSHEGDIPDGVRAHLITKLLEWRIDPSFLEYCAGEVGWADAWEYFVTQGIPTASRYQKGEFGETLIAALLMETAGYVMPVYKLRKKIVANETQHGTDTLMLLLDNQNRIQEVCYLEVKFRTTADNKAAVESYEQLIEHYNERVPDIVRFIIQELYERQDPLLGPFRAYLSDRRDSRGKDSFRIGLCWDKDSWHEQALVNLNEADPKDIGLIVHVVQIRELNELSKACFDELGMIEVLDD